MQYRHIYQLIVVITLMSMFSSVTSTWLGSTDSSWYAQSSESIMDTLSWLDPSQYILDTPPTVMFNHELYYDHAVISSEPLAVWSPFTKNSKYLELSVQGIAESLTGDGTKYQFSIITDGFIAKKRVSIHFHESYQGDNGIITADWDTLVNYKKDSTTHFTFRVNFSHFNPTLPGYYRAVILRFDIVEFIDSTTPSIKIESTADKTGTRASHVFVKAPEKLLSQSLQMDLKREENQFSKFILNLENSQIQLSSETISLTIYSYFNDYYFMKSDESNDGNVYQCLINDTIVNGILDSSSPSPSISLDLTTIEPIPLNSTIIITCDDIIVKAKKFLHYSEYWVVSTPSNYYSVQYIKGVNRTDFHWYFILIIVLAAVLLITGLIIAICCCRCKKACCFK